MHDIRTAIVLTDQAFDLRASLEKFFRDGHIREIADYCKSDVINTYRVWLRYELFRGNLTDVVFKASESNLADFVKARDME